MFYDDLIKLEKAVKTQNPDGKVKILNQDVANSEGRRYWTFHKAVKLEWRRGLLYYIYFAGAYFTFYWSGFLF